MSVKDIALKHHGYTLEIQMNHKNCYINPHEEYADRSPENGDLIISFIRSGVSELHIEGELSRHLMGIKCYGFDKTQYLLDSNISSYWNRNESNPEAKFSIPNRGKGIESIEDNAFEFGDCLVGTEFLKNDDDERYGVALSFEEVKFTYFYVQEKFVDAFINESSSCAVLVVDNWAREEPLVRKIVLEHNAEQFYLICEQLRKDEYKKFISILLPKYADKIVVKKGKWKYPL